VGSVASVRVRTELRDHPAEVILRLTTPYELEIPRDAVVRLQTAGVLGETLAEIDIHNASGAAIENGGVLKGDSTPQIGLQDLLEKLTQNTRPSPCPSAEDALTDKHRSPGRSQTPKPR